MTTARPVTFTATPRQMEKAFSTVLPHSGDDPVLPMLAVVNCEFGGDAMTLAATDRFTMAVYKTNMQTWHVGEGKFPRVPKLTVNVRPPDLRRLFAFTRPSSKKPATWTITADALSVETELGSASVATANVEFVGYRKILPQVGDRPDQPTNVLTVAPDKIARFSKSAAAVNVAELSARSYETLPLAFWSGPAPTSPIGVTVGPNFLGLLMPVSTEAPNLDVGPFVQDPP